MWANYGSVAAQALQQALVPELGPMVCTNIHRVHPWTPQHRGPHISHLNCASQMLASPAFQGCCLEIGLVIGLQELIVANFQTLALKVITSADK